MARKILFILVLTFLASSGYASTYTVNDLGNAPDQTPGNDVCATAGGVCTLFAAIQEANAHAGADTILFSVIGDILVSGSPLPGIIGPTTISGPAGTVPQIRIVSGWPSAAVDFAPGSNDSLLERVEIVGSSGRALNVDANNITVINNVFTGGNDGVTVFGTNSKIGTPGNGNVIVWNQNFGILIGGTNNSVQGNRIGVDANGANAQNQNDGIRVFNLGNNITIGSLTDPAAGNIIASNFGDGIEVDNSANINIGHNTIVSNSGNGITVRASANNPQNVVIVENSIDGNGGIGIDHGTDGVTLNDAGDTDSGVNGLQNFPEITSTSATASDTIISGTLDSTPLTSFVIHVYGGPTPDPSAHGEAPTFIGSVNTSTNAGGIATFTLHTNSTLPAGIAFLTATATGPTGTSEFSANVAAPIIPPTVQFAVANIDVDESAGTATVTVTRSGDTTSTVTVTYATSNGTANAGSDYTSSAGTLTFLPGDTSETFVVPITDDLIDETSETINVALSSPSGATLGAPSTSTVTILDNDATVAATSVPTLSEWALLALTGLVALLALRRL